jgi:lauroyl/myristoyl acyltransferase
MHDLAHLSLVLASRLPRPIRRGLSIVIGSIAWAAATAPRNAVNANVMQVLRFSKHESSEKPWFIRQTARSIFCNCISNYFELFAMPRLSKQEILDRIDIKGLEHFEDAVTLGRGIIIASAHLGPFEYLPSWFPARGFEMTIPVEKIRNKRILRLMLEARQSNGVNFVSLTGIGAVRQMLRTLKNRQVVLITADRAVEGESAVMNFFGAPARLPMGPVDLAIMAGTPLIAGFGWRNGGRDIIEFMPISLSLPASQRDDRTTLQTALMHRLEEIIGDHIDEWVVFDPIWQKLPRSNANAQNEIR